MFNQDSVVDLAIVVREDSSRERVSEIGMYLAQTPDSVGLDSVDVDYGTNVIFVRMQCSASAEQFDQLVDDMRRFPEIERTEQKVSPSAFAE